MNRFGYLLILSFVSIYATAQTNPIITQWLQNTTGIKGRHYVSGNSTPTNDNDSANVQTVLYSSNWVYIRTKGIPAYISGPFLDGNPAVATSQNAIFKFPLNPVQNTSGTYTATTGGNIGLFINGVALFDYRDGVSWKNSTNSLCGGPIQPPCAGDGVWNRDAVVAEKMGFDCSKGHPAMGNYHHHQNPSAFNLDLVVISNVCNLYLSDGLYAINPSVHSPLIGFAYDGFPIYGAYAYRNADGTGGITRMKSSYSLRNITTRTTYANGTSVTPGPPVSTTYPLGYFREDYEYIPTSAATPDYLDEHNGRFCVTPEYPNGTYAYFTTVDANWNSAYPYAVGPTFYGVKSAVKVTSITDNVVVYSTLPVNLTNFTAEATGKANLLRWTTAGEVNSSYFDVERSSDALKFNALGKVNGAGTTHGNKNYTYTDNEPARPVSYYRLKQVDIDGRSTYSNVISVGAKATGTNFKVFPNPASDMVIVQTNDLLKQDLLITLTDMQGKVVKRQPFYQGSTICFVETNAINSGSYVLTINDGGVQNTYKMQIKR